MITTSGKPHRLPSVPLPSPCPCPRPLFSPAAFSPLLLHHSITKQPCIYLCDYLIHNHLSHYHSTDSLKIPILFGLPTISWTSLVAQMVKTAYNTGDMGSIPVLGRSPGEGNGKARQSSCLQNSPSAEEPGGLQSMGLQRVGHD